MTSPGVTFAPRPQLSPRSSAASLSKGNGLEDSTDRRSPAVTFSTPSSSKPSPALPPSPSLQNGAQQIPIYRTTSSGNGERKEPTAKASNSNLGKSETGSAPGASVATSVPSSRDNNMFGRVVRKLSKRVKPPSQRAAEGEGSSALRGRVDPATLSIDRDAHRRARSREQMRLDDLRPSKGRQPSFEWGPPPLQAGDWAAAAGTQVVEAVPNAKHFALASRSFDSLVSMTGYDGTTPVLNSTAPPSKNPFVSPLSHDRANSSPRGAAAGLPSSVTSPSFTSLNSPPHYATKDPASPPFDPKKVKISSTARGKPASDTPLASVNFPHLIERRVASKGDLRSNAPGSGAHASSSSPERAVDLHPMEDELDSAALLDKGPFWAVQRGWTKGVVTSKEEADRRTKNFPGPVIRFFEANQVDEAIAFVKAGALARRQIVGADDGSPPSSSGSSSLGRSASMVEKGTQPPHRPLQAKTRHNAKGAPQGKSLGGEADSAGAMISGTDLLGKTTAVVQSTNRAAPGYRPSPGTLRLNQFTPELSPVFGTALEPCEDFPPWRKAMDRSALARLFAVVKSDDEPDTSEATAPTSMSLLLVDDLDRSIKFYTSILGLTLTDRSGGEQALIALPTSPKRPTISLRARDSRSTWTSISPSSHHLSGSQILLPFTLPRGSTYAPLPLLRSVKGDFEDFIKRNERGSDLLSATSSLSAPNNGRVLISASADGIERRHWGAMELTLVDMDGHQIILSVAANANANVSGYSNDNKYSASNGSRAASGPATTTATTASATAYPSTSKATGSGLGLHNLRIDDNKNASQRKETLPYTNSSRSSGITSQASPQRAATAPLPPPKDNGAVLGGSETPAYNSSKPDFSQGRPQWTLIRDEEED